MYKNIHEHPISLLNKLGFNISINTDNRLMSNTSYKKEQKILYDLNINPDINKDLASYSFIET